MPSGDVPNWNKLSLPRAILLNSTLTHSPIRRLTLYVPTEEMRLALNAMFHFNKTRIEIGKPLALLPIQNEGILSIRTRENVLSLLSNSVGEIHIFDPQGLLLYQTKAFANTPLEIMLPQGVYFVSFNNRITKVSL